MDSLTCWRPVSLLHGPASARRAELLRFDQLDSAGKQMYWFPPSTKEVNNQVLGAGLVSRLTRSLAEARRCASAAAAAADPVPILKLVFCLRLSFYSVIDAWCWMVRTQSEIPLLSSHFLNLPRCGRNARVYLSLLRWSAWPSSAARIETSHSGETDPFIQTRTGGSEHLCRMRTIPLSSDCASFSDHLSAVLDGPAGL